MLVKKVPLYVGVTFLYEVESISAAAPLMVVSDQSAKVYPYGLLQDVVDVATAREVVVLEVLLVDVAVEFGNAVHELGYISTMYLLVVNDPLSMICPSGPVRPAEK